MNRTVQLGSWNTPAGNVASAQLVGAGRSRYVRVTWGALPVSDSDLVFWRNFIRPSPLRRVREYLEIPVGRALVLEL